MHRRPFDGTFAYAKRVARVSAYALVVSSALGLVVASRASAALGEAALDAGNELAQMGDAIGPRNEVRLNGEAVNVASAVVDDAPSVVIDRFEAECRAHAGSLAADLESLEASARGDATAFADANRGIGTMRRDDAGRSAVACLARDGGAGAVAGLRAMMATGDLSALGHLRFVSAERAPGATKTHVVAAWTSGPLRLGAFTPHEGEDAPGSDPAGAARPPDARRLLTASVKGVPYGVRVYEARAAAREVLARYEDAMRVQGWSATPAVAGELARHGREGRAFSRDGVDLMVFAETDAHDPGRSVVSIVTLPPR